MNPVRNVGERGVGGSPLDLLLLWMDGHHLPLRLQEAAQTLVPVLLPIPGGPCDRKSVARKKFHDGVVHAGEPTRADGAGGQYTRNMNLSPRVLGLLAFVAVTAGAIVVLLGELGGGGGNSTRVAPPEGIAEEAKDAAGDHVEPLASPGVRNTAVQEESTSWDVRAVDGSGRPLADAVLEARGPGEVILSARGRTLWEELEPGTWRLEVSHPDYPDHALQVELEPESTRRSIVRLSETIRITGMVRDRHGAPRPGSRIWFLKPGENHPFDGDSARARLGAVSDKTGGFRIDLPGPGEWRVSVGGVGTAEASALPREIGHGWPTELEVVLSGSTRLTVNFDRVPEVQNRAIVQVLERVDYVPLPVVPDDLPEVSLGVEIEERRRRRARDGSSPDIGLDPGSRTEGSDVGYALPPRPTPSREWINRAASNAMDRMKVVLDGLPVGRELRLALQLDGARFETSQVFSLRGDEVVRIDLVLPDIPDPIPVDPSTLPIQLAVEPLGPDAPEEGFHWR